MDNQNLVFVYGFIVGIFTSIIAICIYIDIKQMDEGDEDIEA